jgi:hypothetical protein
MKIKELLVCLPVRAVRNRETALTSLESGLIASCMNVHISERREITVHHSMWRNLIQTDRERERERKHDNSSKALQFPPRLETLRPVSLKIRTQEMVW